MMPREYINRKTFTLDDVATTLAIIVAQLPVLL